MFIEDYTLSESEIAYLDTILNNIASNYMPRTLHSYIQEWSVLQSHDRFDVLESLRIKGIFETEERKRTISYSDDGNEELRQEAIEVGILQPKQLVFTWLVTVYHRSAKQITFDDLQKITETDSSFSFPIQISDDSVDIHLITKEMDDTFYSKNQNSSMFVSFIGDLPINQQNYIHWYSPLQELSAAARFFAWINEQSKPIISKHFLTIDVPTDLEKSEIENIYNLVKINFQLLEYQYINQPDLYKPESTEYFFSNGLIRGCFIKSTENKKVFLIFSDKKIEVHTFKNGIKALDVEVSQHMMKLQEWIDKKSNEIRNIKYVMKSSLITDLTKLVPMILTIVVSAFTAFGMLWSKNEAITKFTTTNSWFTILLVVNIFAIFVLFYFGLVPSIRQRFFSWDRWFNRYVKTNIK